MTIGTRTMTMLRHNRVDLALHTLRAGSGRPLLVLHGLGERSPERTPAWADTWAGAVTALDFTGHGASTLPRGGGYTAELMLADADRALDHLGVTTIVGRGLGAYIALLLAGARADRVNGAVLADGPGLSGGPSVPTSQPVISLAPAEGTPDPYALAELGRDLRPPDYATAFTRLAMQSSGLEAPIAIVASFRPAWLAATAAEPGVVEFPTIADALASFEVA